MTDVEKVKYCLDFSENNRGLLVFDKDFVKYLRELPENMRRVVDAYETYLKFVDKNGR